MKTAHKYLMDKGVKSMGDKFTAFQVEEMLNEFSDQFKPEWIPVTERLPEIDTDDEWRHKQGHSKIVPVIESDILNLGWYNHQFEGWQVNGRIGNIRVTDWFDLPLPTKP